MLPPGYISEVMSEHASEISAPSSLLELMLASRTPSRAWLLSEVRARSSRIVYTEYLYVSNLASTCEGPGPPDWARPNRLLYSGS